MMSMDYDHDKKYIVKGCNKPRDPFRPKSLYCEKHWKERRKKKNYKGDY